MIEVGTQVEKWVFFGRPFESSVGGIANLAEWLVEGLIATSGWRDRVNKGTRWMSWYLEAMKDVGTCDKS